MQTRFFKLTYALNTYRTYIITAFVLAIVIAMLITPSMVVEAGRAISNGG